MSTILEMHLLQLILSFTVHYPNTFVESISQGPVSGLWAWNYCKHLNFLKYCYWCWLQTTLNNTFSYEPSQHTSWTQTRHQSKYRGTHKVEMGQERWHISHISFSDTNAQLPKHCNTLKTRRRDSLLNPSQAYSLWQTKEKQHDRNCCTILSDSAPQSQLSGKPLGCSFNVTIKASKHKINQLWQQSRSN